MKVRVEWASSGGQTTETGYRSAVFPQSAFSGDGSVRSVFNGLSKRMQSEGLIESIDPLVHELLTREEAGSTVIGSNLANPHAQGSFVNESVLFYLKLAQPIPRWDGSHAVSRVLLTLIPQQPSTKDLQYLRDLYRHMGEEKILGLLEAGSRTDVRQILTTEGK